MEARLLTYQEVAELLNKPEQTLRYWVHKRQIPFLKVGHSVRFDPRDLEQWLDSNRHGVAQ